MSLVPKAGLEPARTHVRRILNPRGPIQGSPNTHETRGKNAYRSVAKRAIPTLPPPATRPLITPVGGYGAPAQRSTGVGRATLWFPRLS
jgi:hypothetical protein